MRIGIPKEMKVLEGRVGLIPAACADLLAQGHEVYVESSAGVLSGYADWEYQQMGVQVVADAAALYTAAELIIKVKEPVEADLVHLRSDHILFCYLHLAANAPLAQRLQAIGLTAIAFETVEADGALPLLAPMSDIAGRVGAQVGAHLLHYAAGGRGLLLGGVPGTERGQVVVIGAGVAGSAAAGVASALGALVTVFDRKRERLAEARRLGPNVTALYPYAEAIQAALREADLVIGAVLVPGARAPHVVTREMVQTMQNGSVIVDISVDQGGCVATTRPTTYAEPTYIEEDVVHFAVTNMPGAVPRTASQALSAALIPLLPKVVSGAWESDAALRGGLNVRAGEIVHPAVTEALA